MPNYGYPMPYNSYGNVQYGSSPFNLEYTDNQQPYTGQSYIPYNNEWLPLPGRDRRRRRRQLSQSAIVSKTDNNPALSTSK